MYTSSGHYHEQDRNVSKNYFPSGPRFYSSKKFFDEGHYGPKRQTFFPSSHQPNSKRQNLHPVIDKSERQSLGVRNNKQLEFKKHFFDKQKEHNWRSFQENNGGSQGFNYLDTINSANKTGQNNSAGREWDKTTVRNSYIGSRVYNGQIEACQEKDISCGQAAQGKTYFYSGNGTHGTSHLECDNNNDKIHQKSEEYNKCEYEKNNKQSSNCFEGKFYERYRKDCIFTESEYNNTGIYKQQADYVIDEGIEFLYDKRLTEEAVQETDGFNDQEFQSYSVYSNLGANIKCTFDVGSVEVGRCSDGIEKEKGGCYNNRELQMGIVHDGMDLHDSLYESRCTHVDEESLKQGEDYNLWKQEYFGNTLSAGGNNIEYPVKGGRNPCNRNYQEFRGVGDQPYSRNGSMVIQNSNSRNDSLQSSEYTSDSVISKHPGVDINKSEENYFTNTDAGYDEYEKSMSTYRGYSEDNKEILANNVANSDLLSNQKVHSEVRLCSDLLKVETDSYVTTSGSEIHNGNRNMEPIGNPTVKFIVKPWGNQLILCPNSNIVRNPIVQPFTKSAIVNFSIRNIYECTKIIPNTGRFPNYPTNVIHADNIKSAVNIIHRPAVVRSLYQVVNPPTNALIKPLPNPVLKPVLHPVQIVHPVRVVRPLIRYAAPRIVPVHRPSMPLVVRCNAIPASVIRHQFTIPYPRGPIYFSNQPQPQTIVSTNIEHVFPPSSIYLEKENNCMNACGILQSVKYLGSSIEPHYIESPEFKHNRKWLLKNATKHIDVRNDTDRDKKFQINPKKQWFDYDCHVLHRKRLRLVSRLRKARHHKNGKEIAELKEAIKKVNREYMPLIRERKTKYISDLEAKGEIELLCEMTVTSLVDRVVQVCRIEKIDVMNVVTEDNLLLGKKGIEDKGSLGVPRIHCDHEACNDDDDDDDDDGCWKEVEDASKLEDGEAVDGYEYVENVEEGNGSCNAVTKEDDTKVGKGNGWTPSGAGKKYVLKGDSDTRSQTCGMNQVESEQSYNVKSGEKSLRKIGNRKSDTKGRQRYIA